MLERGPVAESRLRRLDDGRYEYTPKGDGLPLVLTAEALMKRLAALLPPPRKHLTTFHCVYGPNSKLRPLVVRAPPPDVSTPESSTPPSAAAPRPKPKRPRLDWATLQARTFGEDVPDPPQLSLPL